MRMYECWTWTCCRAIDRCAYPEVFNGTWNMSLTYQTPTLLTRAHFYGADPAVAATTGNNFSSNYDDHSWNYDVEHISGLTIRVHCRRYSALSPYVITHSMMCMCQNTTPCTCALLRSAGAPHLPDQPSHLPHRCGVPQCLDEGARQVHVCGLTVNQALVCSSDPTAFELPRVQMVPHQFCGLQNHVDAKPLAAHPVFHQ
jgi:CD36 family